MSLDTFQGSTILLFWTNKKSSHLKFCCNVQKVQSGQIIYVTPSSSASYRFCSVIDDCPKCKYILIKCVLRDLADTSGCIGEKHGAKTVEPP